MPPCLSSLASKHVTSGAITGIHYTIEFWTVWHSALKFTEPLSLFVEWLAKKATEDWCMLNIRTLMSYSILVIFDRSSSHLGPPVIHLKCFESCIRNRRYYIRCLAILHDGYFRYVCLTCALPKLYLFLYVSCLNYHEGPSFCDYRYEIKPTFCAYSGYVRKGRSFSIPSM